MAIGPDGMWYMTPEEQKISDAINAYEHAVACQLFGEKRVKYGLPESYRMWYTYLIPDKHMGAGMVFYRSDYLTLHAQYQGGP